MVNPHDMLDIEAMLKIQNKFIYGEENQSNSEPIDLLKVQKAWQDNIEFNKMQKMAREQGYRFVVVLEFLDKQGDDRGGKIIKVDEE